MRKIYQIVGGNTTIDLSHVTFEKDADGVEDAILIIEHVELSDRNFYNCTAQNKATEYGHGYEKAEEGTYVRVKGNMNMKFINRQFVLSFMTLQKKNVSNELFSLPFSPKKKNTPKQLKQMVVLNRKISCLMAVLVYLRRSSRLMCHYLSV